MNVLKHCYDAITDRQTCKYTLKGRQNRLQRTSVFCVKHIINSMQCNDSIVRIAQKSNF